MSSASVKRKRSVPRLALSPAEAAASLGVSRDYFDEHVLPGLRVVRMGRRILVDVRELEHWLEANSARTIVETPRDERARLAEARKGAILGMRD